MTSWVLLFLLLASSSAASSFRAVRLSQLESRKSLGEGEGRAGERYLARNFSGLLGEEGEKRRCLFSRGGGVSHIDSLLTGRLAGEGLGVKKPSLIS